MANLTTAISVQIDREDKEKITPILQKLGISMSGLMNMTYINILQKKN